MKIALTLRRRKDSRSQNPSEQVKVTKAQRLRIIKMAPTIETMTKTATAADNTPGAV